MRLIAVSTLKHYVEGGSARRDAWGPLVAWAAEVKKATWKTPADIKAKYKNASFVGDNRVIFNIAGNKYRLIVKVNYPAQIVYVRFIGTHREYDDINAEEV
jgi:mRNA interferase HigB